MITKMNRKIEPSAGRRLTEERVPIAAVRWHTDVEQPMSRPISALLRTVRSQTWRRR